MARPPYLPHLGLLRNVAWGQTWHWDCWFEGAPAPFNTWFPAFEATASIFEIATNEISIGSMTFEQPVATTRSAITLSFYDNDQQILFKWLHGWKSEIFTDDGRVGTLGEIGRRLLLASTNAEHRVSTVIESWVYPKDNTSWIRDSQSGAAILQQQFQPIYMRIRQPEGSRT